MRLLIVGILAILVVLALIGRVAEATPCATYYHGWLPAGCEPPYPMAGEPTPTATVPVPTPTPTNSKPLPTTTNLAFTASPTSIAVTTPTATQTPVPAPSWIPDWCIGPWFWVFETQCREKGIAPPVPTATVQPHLVPVPNLGAERQEMLKLINAERAKLGIQPLRLDDRLNTSAQGKAEWMALTGKITHEGFVEWIDQAGYQGWVWLAENLSGGCSTAQWCYELWRDSPGHYWAMTRPWARDVGLGHARVQPGSPFTDYMTLHLGCIADDTGDCNVTSSVVLMPGFVSPENDKE